MWCFINGTIKPLEDAGLALTDLGILRGYGYFDYLRTYHGVPFLLEEHLDRLERTSNILNLDLPYSRSYIKEHIHELLVKNSFPESHIKIVVTGGPSSDGITVESPSFFILITSLIPNPETLFTEGIKLMTHEHLRLFPEAKSLNYLTALSLRNQKKESNAYEILYIYKGRVLETSTSNIFCFKDDVLITPKDDILEGITRHAVIELAKKRHTVEIREVLFEELLTSDEVFITASNKEVMPVVTIDDKRIGVGIPGKLTRVLLEDYRTYIEEYTKAYHA